MIRQQKFYRSIFYVLSLSFILTACTSKQTPVVVRGSSGSGTQVDSTGTGTGSTNTSSTPSAPLFDTNATTNNGSSSLFDTRLTNDTPATSTTSQPDIQPLSPSQQQCLSSNMGFGLGEDDWDVTNGTSQSANANCIDSNWNGRITPDMLLDYGMGTFGSMDNCYRYVVNRAKPYCTNDTNASQIFQMSKMALVRCFRNILKQQMQLAQWQPEQQQSYNSTDQSLFLLLSLFSQGD